MVAVARQSSSSPPVDEVDVAMPASNSSSNSSYRHDPRDIDVSHMYSPQSPPDHSHLSDAAMKQMDLLYCQQQGPPFPLQEDQSPSAIARRKEIFNQRKQREFIPDNKKDDSYWDRRRRNNEAAKRSREKRRFNDMILEQRVMELTKENHVLSAQLLAIKDKYGIQGETLVNIDQVLATLPSSEQVLAFTKRTNKILCSPLPPASTLLSPLPPLSPRPPTPVPTPVIHDNIPLDSKSSVHSEPYGSPYHCYTVYPSPYNVPTLISSYEQNVLNLSSRNRTESFGESSCSGGSPVSMTNHESSGEEETPPAVTNAGNSNLPHKLRHKIHLGEKDAANTLLSLQMLKNEQATLERSQADWYDTGSSDERDSGISVGAEWLPNQHSPPSDGPGAPPRKRARVRRHNSDAQTNSSPEMPEEKHVQETAVAGSQFKCELARLAIEVANLKTILSSRKKTGAPEVSKKDSFLIRQLKQVEHHVAVSSGSNER